MSPTERMYLLFLFIAYTALFIAMFVFLGRMLMKSRQLEDDVRLLKEEWLREDAEPPAAQTRGNVPLAPSVHREEVGR